LLLASIGTRTGHGKMMIGGLAGAGRRPVEHVEEEIKDLTEAAE
jgi:hypothetical protein